MIRILSILFVTLAINACSKGGFGTESSAELTQLESTEGTLSPGFSVTELNYWLTIDPSVSSVSFRAVAFHDASTIHINGSKTSSGAMSEAISTLDTPTTVAIRVTSPDELRTNTYRITIIVPGQEDQLPEELENPPPQTPDDNDTSAQGDGGMQTTSEDGDAQSPLDPGLSSLSVTTPTFSQELESNGSNYSIHVGNTVNSVEIDAVPNTDDASITINGQSTGLGQTSASIAVDVGASVVPITVTSASEDVQQDYTLTIVRSAALTYDSLQTIDPPDPQRRNSSFGFSTALAGDWLAISAPTQDNDFPNGGNVYVFKKAGDQWRHHQTLQSPSGDSNNRFGYSLAISSEFLAIGSYGADNDAENSGQVDLYQRNGDQWSHALKLTPPSASDNGRFGFAIAMDGETLAVAELQGIDGSVTGGGVTVYEHQGQQWKIKKTIPTRGASDRFATNLALSGNLLAIGAFDYDGECKTSISDPGEVTIYERKNGDWTEQATLRASNGDGGDRFGFSVALNQDRLAVGAICEDSKRFAPQKNEATQSGSVYLFKRSGNQWTQLKQLKASDAEAHDLFGYRLQLVGETLIATAPLEDSKARDAGAAYVFDSTKDWEENKLLRPIDGQRGDNFGVGLGFDGSSLVISAHQLGDRNRQLLGKAYSYQ